MSGGIEAAGDIATGALIADAVDRHHLGDGGHGGACRNCGTALIGAHCHACGQAAHVHRTLGAIGHDIAHGVFHLEGRTWRTLPMLVTRPGMLTRRYIDGERVGFVSPMALFLFSVFLMFAVVANLPGWTFGDGKDWAPGASVQMAQMRETLAGAEATAARDLAEARRDLADENAKTPPDADRLARLTRRVAKATKEQADAATAVRLLPDPSLFDGEVKPQADENWIEAKWRHVRENPKLFLYKIKTSAYKFSWALIPLSLPFVWLLFPFSRRFPVYDHAIFTTYSLTFMSLLTIALALLSAAGVATGLLVAAAIIVPPFHIYRQLKGTYRLRRASALVRTALLLGMIVFAIIPLFALLLAYLGVAD